jgi:enoyl-CoA hydratase/carnithine racemase
VLITRLGNVSKPLNAFSKEYVSRLWTEYGQLFERLIEEGPDVRAVVLSSSLPKIFTAGLDRMSMSLIVCYFWSEFLPKLRRQDLGTISIPSQQEQLSEFAKCWLISKMPSVHQNVVHSL